MEKLLRQKGSNLFSPLKPTAVSTIKILFYSDIQGLHGIIQAIKVKMIDESLCLSLVFIDDSKSGTTYRIRYLKGFCKGFDQGSLSCTHFTSENPNFLIASFLN